MHRGLLSDRLAHLLVEVSEEAVLASTPFLSDASTPAKTFLRHRLLSVDLQCTEKFGRVSIGVLKEPEQCKIASKPFSSIMIDEVLERLGDFLLSGFYAVECQGIRALRASNSLSCDPPWGHTLSS